MTRNILVLPSWYPTPRYPIGGIFFQSQARALNTLDDTRVVVLFIDRLSPGEWLRARRRRATLRREDGLPVYRTSMLRVPMLWPLLYVLHALLAVRVLMKRHNFVPDLVHAHVALPAGLAAAFIKRMYGIPFVLTEHTNPFSLLMRNAFARLATRTAMRAANRVVAVSTSLRRDILAYPKLQRSIDVIPNVVDVDAFAPTAGEVRSISQGSNNLLFVGEMETRNKGVEYLLEALSLLRNNGLDITLDLVGGGQHLAEYRSQALRLGLGDTIRFHGLVPHDRVKTYFHNADLFVLPSIQETFGVVLVEALSAGLPIVATRSGGPEDVVTTDVGVLVEPGNPTALANAIEDVLSRPDDFPAERMREVARSRYSPPVIAGRLAALYDQVLQEARRP
jgi:glycosyltransferase involved in cell wall biosynthesis